MQSGAVKADRGEYATTAVRAAACEDDAGAVREVFRGVVVPRRALVAQPLDVAAIRGHGVDPVVPSAETEGHEGDALPVRRPPRGDRDMIRADVGHLRDVRAELGERVDLAGVG